MIERNFDQSRQQTDALAERVSRDLFEREAPDTTVSFMDWDESHEQARDEKYQRVENRLEQIRSEAFLSGASLGAATHAALEIVEKYTERRDLPHTAETLVEELSAQRRYNIAADPIEFQPLTEASAKRLQELPLHLLRKAEQVVHEVL